MTRVVRDTEFFATLGRHKSVIAYASEMDLANALWESVEHKANRTPTADRAATDLVHDAFEFYFKNNDPSVRLFAKIFGERAKALGFRAIWIVGPHHSFVTTLA